MLSLKRTSIFLGLTITFNDGSFTNLLQLIFVYVFGEALVSVPSNPETNLQFQNKLFEASASSGIVESF